MAIDLIDPIVGGPAGGTIVGLQGSGFTGSTGVTFDGLAGTGFIFIDDTLVIIYTPAHAVGSVTVALVGTTFSVSNGFTYQLALTEVEPPAVGASMGGNPIHIDGMGLTGATQVTLGGLPATSVVVMDDTRLSCVTPAHANGYVDVTVVGVGTLPNGFLYDTPSGVYFATEWGASAGGKWWVSSDAFATYEEVFPWDLEGGRGPIGVRTYYPLGPGVVGIDGWIRNSLIAGAPMASIGITLYYAGVDYAGGNASIPHIIWNGDATAPTIWSYDGSTNVHIGNVPVNPDNPDGATFASRGVLSMVAGDDGFLYLTVYDGGTTVGGTAKGSVRRLDPGTGTFTQLGSTFSALNMPYCLAWHDDTVWVGTNSQTNATSGKVYSWDGATWQLSFDFNTASSTIGVGSLTSFGGDLYAGGWVCLFNATVSPLIKRLSGGTWTTSFTGTAKTQGFTAMTVVDGDLYAAHTGTGAAPIILSRVRKLNGGAWTDMGLGNTTQPFGLLAAIDGTLFATANATVGGDVYASVNGGTTWGTPFSPSDDGLNVLFAFTTPVVITITPTVLSDASAGTAYSAQLAATGGTAPYVFTVVSGTLPTGLSLSSAGLLAGTPSSTAAALTPATFPNGTVDIFYSEQMAVGDLSTPFSFTVRATDINADFGEQAYSMSTVSWANPSTFAVITGTAPKCLTCSATGLLSGYPIQVGVTTFTVEATDSGNRTTSLAYTFTAAS